MHQSENVPYQPVITKSFHRCHQLLRQKNSQLVLIILSLAISCFLLSYSSAFYCFCRTVDFYRSGFIRPIFGHALERKCYMFLICNGILAFVTKTSRFGTPYRLEPETSEMEQPAIISNKEESSIGIVKHPTVEKKQQQEEDDDDGHAKIEKRAQESVCVETAVKGSEDVELTTKEEETEESGPVIEGRPRGEVIGMNEEILNIDELNKKFDEFIRRMKEELRIEALRQLVVA